MELADIVHGIQVSGAGEWMRTSVRAMPFVEALHVLAATTVFGTVLIVDLRLLGVASQGRPYTRVSDEMLGFTWTAFVVAAITGALMFSANAHTYFINTSFRFKMLAMLCAGINMVVFQTITRRSIARWDSAAPVGAARVAGALSILLWVAVIVLARWVGFTKGYDFSVPDDPNIKFEF